jgi:SUR7/PalI family
LSIHYLNPSPDHARSRIDDLANVIDGALTFALVLHPILCGLAFLAMICATAAAFRQHRGLGVCALLLAGFTALLATISFIIDLCLVATTKSRVEHISDNLHVGWGAITWMTLTAAICLWIGSVTLCLTFLRSKRSKSVSFASPRLSGNETDKVSTGKLKPTSKQMTIPG